MYSLDINFLKERPEYLNTGISRPAKLSRAGNSTALYLGLAIGLLLPTVVGAGWLYLQNQNARLEQEIATLDAELSRLGIQEQEFKKIQEETNQVKAQNQALATVFNHIRPWSALLQDIRERIPTAVQIENVKQIAAAANQPQPTAPPKQGQPAPNPVAAGQGQPNANSASGIEISGMARSFSDVNDFLLTLQQSPFFNPADTKIVTAELTDNPAQAAVPVSSVAAPITLKSPQGVRYTIQSGLSDAQASQLMRELERKGALGLVTRIRTLQQQGVIQP